MIKNREIIFTILIASIILTTFVVDTASAPVVNIAPTIGNIAVDSTTDITATITFAVDQIDANTIIRYGTRSGTLGQRSDWNNGTGIPRTIILSGLTGGTKYFYSIYAYNGTNSKSSHSSTGSFTTNVLVNKTVNDTAPTISQISETGITTSTVNISFSVDQNDANTIINYGTTNSLGIMSGWNNKTSSLRTIMLSNLSNGTTYDYSIYAYNGTNQSLSTNSAVSNFKTDSSLPTTNLSGPSPTISNPLPTGQFIQTTGVQPGNFAISFDQIVNVTWLLNGTTVQTNNSVSSSNYANNTPSIGIWNVTVIGENGNGSKSYSWIWTVSPELSHSGNRVWDGTKGMSTNYTWDAYSFSGFYYDLDSNLSTEQLTMTNIQSTIAKGNIIYSTSPAEVNFQHSAFGQYQVIGFMADKYFAGYTTNSSISDNKPISAIANGQLQKIIFDDDNKTAIYVGSTLTLGEGYVLQMKEVDVGAGTGQIWIVLLKDGNEVDNSVITAGNDYIYTKKVGTVSNFPIIAVHFDTVFRGTEVNAAFVRGIFQVSEIQNSVRSGDTYGVMEISGVSSDKITMDNKDSISLTTGGSIDLMGNLKIIVADSSTLRFALSVDRTGEFEVRGTIYPVTSQWTPMNFGLNIGNPDIGYTNIGFYYDLDQDIGTESLKVASISGNSIPEGGLIYSTSPQEVSFTFPDFGKYQVIGFMADKYFAGYTANTNPPAPSTSIGIVSTISQGQLHKILVDDEDKRVISVGSTLTLQDGYVLKAKDIDLGARTMLLSLLKDGNEVDSTPLSAGQTYVYTKKVGSISNLPIIMTRFDSVFSGAEVQAAFIKGMFQISDTATSVKTGDTFGSMKISSVSADGINMDNPNSIGLSAGNTVSLMGNLQFKVADSSDVRFYPFVLTSPEMVANQLIVNAPNKATAGDNITINVTSGGAPTAGVSIDIEPGIGPIGNNTDNNGIINVTIPITSSGTYNITATKLGYQSGNTSIEIARYIPQKLSINAPQTADQSDTISIQVTSNNTVINNATIMFDNTTIGSTDNGTLNYTLELDGNHTITASKDRYITVSKDIYVRAPYSEFIGQDIHIMPNSTFTNENVQITSNITNVGTRGDTKSIDLIINGTSVNNKSITIDRKETKEINFTYKVSQPEGNYTIEILEQKGLLQVKKAPFNIIGLGAILTVIGAIIIYLITARGRGKTTEGNIAGSNIAESITKYTTAVKGKIIGSAESIRKRIKK